MACAPAAEWMSTLPLVLLGLRSSVREDSGTSPAELVFGTVLRLPGQMLPEVSPDSPPPTADFVRDLEEKMKRCFPSMPVLYHGSRPSHLPASLQSSTHVYVRVDAVHPPLSRPYEGPYRVLQHGDKTFSVDKSGRPWRVSVDRLKPAFFHSDQVFSPSSSTEHHDDLADTAEEVAPVPVPPPRDVEVEADMAVPAPPAAVPAAPAAVPAVPAAAPAASAAVPDVQGAVAPPDIPVTTRAGRVSRPPNRLDL